MIVWCAILLSLALIQIVLYRMSIRVLERIALGFWAMLYLSLVIAEAIRRLFLHVGLSWWVGLVTAFVGYLIGELFFIYFRDEGKTVRKTQQSLPSFFSFSLIFLMLAWLSRSHAASVEETHVAILAVSVVSIILSAVMVGINERLSLQDAPNESWRGFHLLLISAALLLIGLHGFKVIGGV